MEGKINDIDDVSVAGDMFVKPSNPNNWNISEVATTFNMPISAVSKREQ